MYDTSNILHIKHLGHGLLFINIYQLLNIMSNSLIFFNHLRANMLENIAGFSRWLVLDLQQYSLRWNQHGTLRLARYMTNQ